METESLPQSADTLDDARRLALHYQSIAAVQGGKLLRLNVALKIIREFGMDRGWHSGVMLTIKRWMDDGMDKPIPWPESVFFDEWAETQGMSNIDGHIGYRLTATLVR